MTHIIILTMEHRDFGTMTDKREYKSFTKAIQAYNVLIHDLRGREATGEITNWNVNIY